ncbi:hypothetical protein TBR22_A52960 [Luteitalea sp. TBR-22]|uniref:hypothetical protein n=1 Tax=Luteitalea sp. TBR-22 TaxID=2802971 RepID=UPI001AF05F6E|nr:hypothetical protein [Luteitalea sp. TBR-22]BCS36059.1 hypothetical protein TBR22_A52960 [Luteitalea sp. TBR-22]
MSEEAATVTGWKRHLLKRDTRTRTTWLLRAGLLLALFAALRVTAPLWVRAIGESLVCSPGPRQGDAILVENFDPEYLLFERARDLKRSGVASRVLVPVRVDPGTTRLNSVSTGIADVMARISAIGPIELVPIREVEPISLNAAKDIRRYLDRERIRSVVLVTPLFRSRRSALVYGAVMARSGITVHCDVDDQRASVAHWSDTWHGVQNVLEQWVKLQYYRFRVMPFLCCPEDGR